MKRLNKEYKLNLREDMSLKYGSINRDNPQVIYISGKCWISPLRKMMYENVICDISNKFKKNIKAYMLDGENFDNKLIVNFDINTSKMSLGEKKFLSFDFYLKQNESKKRELKAFKKLLANRVKIIVDDLAESLNENNFSIDLKK